MNMVVYYTFWKKSAIFPVTSCYRS